MQDNVVWNSSKPKSGTSRLDCQTNHCWSLLCCCGVKRVSPGKRNGSGNRGFTPGTPVSCPKKDTILNSISPPNLSIYRRFSLAFIHEFYIRSNIQANLKSNKITIEISIKGSTQNFI